MCRLDTSTCRTEVELVSSDSATSLTWQGCLAGHSSLDCTTGTVEEMNHAAAVIIRLSWQFRLRACLRFYVRRIDLGQGDHHGTIDRAIYTLDIRYDASLFNFNFNLGRFDTLVAAKRRTICRFRLDQRRHLCFRHPDQSEGNIHGRRDLVKDNVAQRPSSLWDMTCVDGRLRLHNRLQREELVRPFDIGRTGFVGQVDMKSTARPTGKVSGPTRAGRYESIAGRRGLDLLADNFYRRTGLDGAFRAKTHDRGRAHHLATPLLVVTFENPIRTGL